MRTIGNEVIATLRLIYLLLQKLLGTPGRLSRQEAEFARAAVERIPKHIRELEKLAGERHIDLNKWTRITAEISNTVLITAKLYGPEITETVRDILQWIEWSGGP